jgi:hypothetical protein
MQGRAKRSRTWRGHVRQALKVPEPAATTPSDIAGVRTAAQPRHVAVYSTRAKQRGAPTMPYDDKDTDVDNEQDTDAASAARAQAQIIKVLEAKIRKLDYERAVIKRVDGTRLALVINGLEAQIRNLEQELLGEEFRLAGALLAAADGD